MRELIASNANAYHTLRVIAEIQFSDIQSQDLQVCFKAPHKMSSRVSLSCASPELAVCEAVTAWLHENMVHKLMMSRKVNHMPGILYMEQQGCCLPYWVQSCYARLFPSSSPKHWKPENLFCTISYY